MMTAIGSSGLDVFPLGLGGNTFGWTSDRETSFAVLDAFVAAGGNLIDTADSYSAWAPGNTGGESETIIGEWLAARGNRDSVVIATKVSRHPRFRGLSRGNVLAAADASLARLRTGHIDLYYAHHDDPEVPVAEAVGVFGELQKAGKIRHVGLSNFTAPRLREWVAAAAAEGLAAPVALQPHYNLLERASYETSLAPSAAEFGLGVLPYYALASGFLAGQVPQRRRPRGGSQAAGCRQVPDAGRARRARGARFGCRRPRRLAGDGGAGLAAHQAGCGGAARQRPHRGTAARAARVGRSRPNARRDRGTR